MSEARERTLELAHVLTAVAGAEIAIHRRVAAQHEDRAAGDGQPDRAVAQPAVGPRRPRDDLGVALQTRDRQRDLLRLAVAHRPADDHLRRERARSTGTLMSDAFGAAVSAAICAGDLIWLAAAQPAPASSTIPTRAAMAVRALPSNFIETTSLSPTTPTVQHTNCTGEMRER